jgi:hypothetical protein
MVEETTTMVVVKVEEANADSVVEVEFMDDLIVSIVGKMITSAQISI